MSVRYQIDRERGLIETRCTGHVTLDQVLAHFRELMEDPSLPEQLDVLLDLSETTSQPGKAQLEEITSALHRLRSTVQWGSCAIVAKRDVLFGMSRMFAVFLEGVFSAASVFREREDAEQWLALQGTARERE